MSLPHQLKAYSIDASLRMSPRIPSPNTEIAKMPRLVLFYGKRKAGDCTGAAAAVVETAAVEYEDTEVEFDPHAWRVMPGGGSIQMNPDEVETGTAAEEEASATAQEASAAAEAAASAAAEEAESAAAEEEGEGQRRTSDRPNTMALGSYRESVAGTQATRFEKTEDQLHQKIKQLKTALYQQDKTSIADIVAVFREQAHIMHTVVKLSGFVKHGHNGLFLTHNCPIHAILALLWVADISTEGDIAPYKNDTADKQTYRWTGYAPSTPLFFPYTINQGTGIIGAAANSPSPHKKKQREPHVNAYFKTWTFKVPTGDGVLTYAVTAVVSIKAIRAHTEIVVRYRTEADALDFDTTSRPPMDVLP